VFVLVLGIQQANLAVARDRFLEGHSVLRAETRSPMRRMTARSTRETIRTTGCTTGRPT
jgi:hypothetical protein